MAIARALLVSADPVTIQQCSRALEEFSISPDVCQEAASTVHLLNRRKFDAVIVDLQLGEQAGLILDEVHLSPSNRTAVTFAISSSAAESTAFRKRSEFVFERPLSPQSIRSTLKPAYGLILRERRRYFRCAASVPVIVLRTNMPGDPDSYWYDRFGSLRLPLAYAKSRHVPLSLRVPNVMVCAIWWQKVGCYCRK
jgi:CheY-like chemotaxis protein